MDFDKCILDSYDVFVFANKMSVFTQVRSVRVIQNWVRAGMPSYRRKVDEANPLDTAVLDAASACSPRTTLVEAKALDAVINV